MSHKKLRAEKNCLNCGQLVEERFCSSCGQENLQFQESAFHLTLHYFQDLFHYNGKFWHTFKHFVRKPGLVASDYMAGKRQSHLKPIQFYVFASTVFFIFLFFIADPSIQYAETSADDYEKRLYHLEQERGFLADSPDTVHVDSLVSALQLSHGDTINGGKDTPGNNNFTLDLLNTKIGSSTDNSWLENFLSERINSKTDEMNRTHQGDERSAIMAFLTELLHAIPQLIFLSLPFFALFLLGLYFPSNRNSYVANFIFSIYHYSYLYMILLFYLATMWVKDEINWAPLDDFWGWITVAFVIYPFVYLYLSMRRFYGDKGISLVLRYFTLLFLIALILLCLFLVVSFITFIL